MENACAHKQSREAVYIDGSAVVQRRSADCRAVEQLNAPIVRKAHHGVESVARTSQIDLPAWIVGQRTGDVDGVVGDNEAALGLRHNRPGVLYIAIYRERRCPALQIDGSAVVHAPDRG